ncbi:conserved hypothetical protein [Methylocella silvestris BL2]|uniref:SHOCT domain-containing protein n=1 Tax=Methylocella silvestris (strain DSM 15510 / CIP 108128 / LMG 27833 / NCIMB 13906 / BL2) TaxID=395965 RepID=B8EN81_METSB|nr:SHOCT domain-containing protein [Methylocella silvestris]ACK49594.1 conserved hypothetical protein [Methylocella silvestris BL2]
MQGLTPEGQRLVDEIAVRHGFSSDAASSLFQALALGNGVQAQFNHPEFGGMGQWSQGGMIMIGDMFNQNLKWRVSALCDDLAGLSRTDGVFVRQPPAPSSWQGQSYNVSGASVSLYAQGFGGGWWPADLGQPSSSGSQNDLQYAFFPGARRLAIRKGERITVYDSGDHNISGVSQQQGGDQTLTFSSQYGAVRLGDLKIVGQPDAAPPVPPQSTSPRQEARAPDAQILTPVDPQMNFAAPRAAEMPAPQASESDVFVTLEKLAALREKKIISDDEFAAKKSELLARL